MTTEHGSHDECYACPVGSFFAELRAAEPEAMEHVLNATYELLEVARIAIDAAERAIDEQRAHLAANPARSARTDRTPSGGRRVRRIDIA